MPRTTHTVQGYLAHKKKPTPLGPSYDPRHGPAARSQGGVFSYERGTPVLRSTDGLTSA